MRLINTKAHGIFDYLVMAVLISSPALFNYSTGSLADKVNLWISVYIICSSLVTNFEISIFKIIPLKAHLNLDLVAGAFLASSPWLLGYQDVVFKPQLVFGMAIIAVSLLTDRIPSQEVMKMMGKSKAVRRMEAEKEVSERSAFPGFKLIHEASEQNLVRTVKKHFRFIIK
jgi:hypothetical protein